jgi:hypothetical protein
MRERACGPRYAGPYIIEDDGREKPNDMIAMMAVTVAVSSIGNSFRLEGPFSRLLSVRGPWDIAKTFPCCTAQLFCAARSRH